MKMEDYNKRLRQPIVVVLGHVDHGKCLLPEERVILPEYGPITLKELFDSAGETVIVDAEKEIKKLGAKLTIAGEDGRLKVLESPYIWRVRHSGKMLRIRLKNWHSVSVTPEHPFLTTRGWVRADRLKPGDYVAVPRVIYGNEREDYFTAFVYEKLKNDELIAKLREDVLEAVSGEFHGDKAYKVKRNVFRREDIETLDLWEEVDKVAFTPRIHRSGKPLHYIKLPRSSEEWETFFYFAGVMFGDGSQDKIANNDIEVCEELKKLSSPGLSVKRVKRRTSFEIEFTKGKNALFRLLRAVFEYPDKQKAKNIKVPRILFIAPCRYVAMFLKGYFDADGYVSEKDMRIEVTSASNKFLEDLSLVLLRFGIVSKLYRSNYTTLVISGRRNLEMFKEHIGFSVWRKEEALRRIISRSKKSESYPIFEELKRLRLLFGFTRTELNSSVPFYGKYESSEAPSYETLMRILEAIERGSPTLDRKVAVLEGK
jgi:translation initiation factor 5B